MSETVIGFCSALLEDVGEQLAYEFNTGMRSRNMKDMFCRFNKSNETASKKINDVLVQNFAYIQWLDAEFDAKECVVMKKGDYWICDPIDGALNFLQGVPFWSLSLCLIHDGQPQLSIVYDPCRKELFHASAGLGSFLNGSKVRVSNTENVANSILATAHPTFIQEYREDSIKTTKNVSGILPQAQAVRMMGTVSLQLAYVASWRFDGYWENGFDMFDWWAGAFLVHEAGGVVTDISNNEFTWGSKGIIAANSILHPQLKTEIDRSASTID